MIRALSLFLLVGSLPSSAEAPSGALVVPEHGFSVRFPAPPRAESSDSQTEAGTLKSFTWSYEAPGDQGYWAVSVTGFPPAAQKTWVPAKVLEGAQSGAIANIKGTLKRDLTVMIPDAVDKKLLHPGREFHAELPGEAAIHSRMFLVGPTLVQVMFVVGKGSAGEAEFKRFADSFTLLPPPAPAKRK
jgi:hypothetical protein